MTYKERLTALVDEYFAGKAANANEKALASLNGDLIAENKKLADQLSVAQLKIKELNDKIKRLGDAIAMQMEDSSLKTLAANKLKIDPNKDYR